MNRVIDDLVTRFEYRVAQFRDWRRYNSAVEQGLVVVPVVAALAALGALTAVVLTRSGSETVYFPQSNADSVSSAGPSTAPKEAMVRVVRRPATGGNAVIRTVSGRGTTVEGLVRLPGRTVREVHTLTTQQIATVTDVQPVTVTAPPVTVTAPPVTVTVVETVKCKPKDC